MAYVEIEIPERWWDTKVKVDGKEIYVSDIKLHLPFAQGHGASVVLTVVDKTEDGITDRGSDCGRRSAISLPSMRPVVPIG